MRILKENEVGVDKITMIELCNYIRKLCNHEGNIKPSEIKSILEKYNDILKEDKEHIYKLCDEIEELYKSLNGTLNSIKESECIFTEKDRIKLDAIHCVVQDEDYNHTDNNFSDDYINRIEELEKKVNNLEKDLIITSGYYNSIRRSVVFVLKNGEKIEVPVSSLVDIYDGDNETIIMNKRTNTFSLSDKILEKINRKEGK